MKSSLIGELHAASLFMRSTALTVLFTFTLMILEPAIAAAQTTGTTAPEALATTVTAEDQLSNTLQHIEAKLLKLEDKLARQLDGSQEKSDLKQLQQTLGQLDQTVRQGFQQVEQHLNQQGLPTVIMERHQAMVTHYAQEYQALVDELNAIDSAGDDNQRLTHAQQALNRLKTHKNKRSQQPFDPHQLPNSSLKPDPNNTPKETEAGFTQAGLFNTPHQHLAALGDFTFDKLAGASNPAYLAETDEVVLTQAIRDKAAELNDDPVKIYHWVRNHVEWQPTWGAIQDAALTLSAQRGNAMDIAGLTIALLRASKIPARYVHGTIDVPAEAFKNWAGGFDTVTAAADYASAGGIPVTTVSNGGQITKVRIEHIWVEAAIDYSPSRGAVNKDADSWVALDPSYKQYEHLTGLDVVAISGIDPEQLSQNFVDSGTVNDSESWATGFDPTILQNAQTLAQQKLEDYIQNNLNDPTVGEVIGGRKTIIEEYPVLPSALPNAIKVIGSRYDKLPAPLQQSITWAFSQDILGHLNDPISLPFARVNNRKITLSFKPATEADEQALLALLPAGDITDLSQLPTRIPGYLINVIPELKLEGQVIKTGSARTLGQELDFITATRFAGRGLIQNPRTYRVIAGSYLAVNAYAGSVSPALLQNTQAKLETTKTVLESADQTQISALTRQELLGDLFHAGGLGYYTQLVTLSHMIGLQAQGQYTLAAGTGTFGYEPKVDYFFGVPRALTPGGVTLDIPLITIQAVNDGNANDQKQFTLQTGVLSSTLEHAVPEQLFVNEQNPGEAISAVKALQKANAQGQRIYHMTQANQAAILTHIHHDPATACEKSL